MIIRRSTGSIAALFGAVIGSLVSTTPLHAATPAPHIVVAITQSGSPFAGGQTNVYRVSVSNIGTAASGGFYVQASVPNNTTVSAAQAGGASCTGSWPCEPGQDLYWYQGLGIGQSKTYQFSAQLQSPAPADGAVVATTVTTSLSGGASIGQKSLVRSAGGLTVGISCPPGSVAANGYLTCVIRYGNTGTSTISANLSYTVPSGLSVISETSKAETSGAVVTWPALSLAAGASGLQSVNLRVATGVSAGSILVHSVSLQATSGNALPANAGTETFVGSSDALEVAASANPDPVEPGQNVTYSVKVSNPGANNTGGFYLYASVPNGMSVPEAQANSASCTGSWPCEPGQELYWYQGLAAGQAVTYEFAAQLPSSGAPPAGTLLTSTLTTGLGGSAVSVVMVAK